MAVQSRGKAGGTPASRGRHARAWTATARGHRKIHNASALAGHELIELIESQARHPSSATEPRAVGDAMCPACGWGPTTAAAAPDAIRRLVILARAALGGAEDVTIDRERRALDQASCFERVARLRDELHVTANRVARFEIDGAPTLSPVRIAASTAASATLAPGILVAHLDLSAARLIALVQARPDAWDKVGRMGDTAVTAGDLVNAVVHGGLHDLLNCVHDSSSPATSTPLTGEERRASAR